MWIAIAILAYFVLCWFLAQTQDQIETPSDPNPKKGDCPCCSARNVPLGQRYGKVMCYVCRDYRNLMPSHDALRLGARPYTDKQCKEILERIKKKYNRT